MKTVERNTPHFRHLYFDFECEQDSGQHIPNFLVAETTCDGCTEQELIKESKCVECGKRCSLCDERNAKTKKFARPPCDGCGYRYITFEGVGCHYQFSEWLFSEWISFSL